MFAVGRAPGRYGGSACFAGSGSAGSSTGAGTSGHEPGGRAVVFGLGERRRVNAGARTTGDVEGDAHGGAAIAGVEPCGEVP